MSILNTIKDGANALREASKIKEYKEINELRKKNSEIEDENRILKSKLNDKEAVEFLNNAYYKKGDKDGPYCTRCFDKNNDLIRIIPNSVGSDYATCPECKNQVNYTGHEINQFHNNREISWR